MDNQDTHPLHFHLISGYVNISKGLVSKKEDYLPYLYSRDIYGVPPQQTISFYLKFPNYASDQGSLNPKVLWTGFMGHCHLILHHDMNMLFLK
jgi:FtsP/CotA-like multicopper oxidase with cupredoxin domain